MTKSGQDIADLRIDSLAAGGDGVGRDADGRVTFVPQTAPGDKVRVSVTVAKKRFARAHLLEVVAAGDVRVEPKCDYFRDQSCGGCQWQHVERSAQLAAKQAITAKALARLVEAGLELRPILDPAPALGWRRRARLHWFRPPGSARAFLGFFAPRSHLITDIRHCLQLAEPLQHALVVLQDKMSSALHRRGELSLLVGRAGDVHVFVDGPANPRAVAQLVGEATIVGVRLGRQVFGARDVELEPGFRGGAHEFAQASALGNTELRRLVVDAVHSEMDEPHVAEFFAGTGNFTRSIAEQAGAVVAVDRTRGVATPGVAVLSGDAVAIAREFLQAKRHFDVCMVDPPRGGAAALMPELAGIKPRRIVYVSCNPATLARDAESLLALGYRPVWAQAVDLMPQTAEIEVVLVLESGPLT